MFFVLFRLSSREHVEHSIFSHKTTCLMPFPISLFRVLSSFYSFVSIVRLNFKCICRDCLLATFITSLIYSKISINKFLKRFQINNKIITKNINNKTEKKSYTLARWHALSILFLIQSRTNLFLL